MDADLIVETSLVLVMTQERVNGAGEEAGLQRTRETRRHSGVS